MKPIVKYRGGKSKELKNYIHHIENEEYETYFEPFIGGGATYFALEPQRAVINDINSKLMSLYNDVKYNYQVLREQLNGLEDIYRNNQRAYEQLKTINTEERVPNDNESM